jgi:hypothetical protein
MLHSIRHCCSGLIVVAALTNVGCRQAVLPPLQNVVAKSAPSTPAAQAVDG